jgi:quinol monooxygenase YgiN
MIHVIAEIETVPEHTEAFIAAFLANIPAVLAEAGCIRYELTASVDIDTPIQVACPPHRLRVIEAWESVAALKAHFQAPHMLAFKQATTGFSCGTQLHVQESLGA